MTQTPSDVVTIKVVLPDAGPLITLSKLGLLEALLCFKPEIRLVLTDYVEFEVTRRRGEMADADAIHDFIRDNYGRIEIMETSYGQMAKTAALAQEAAASDPALAPRFGLSASPTPVPRDA